MSARYWICLFAGLLMQISVRAAPVEAITFAAEPGRFFIPVEEAARELRWPVLRDDMGRVFQLNTRLLTAGSLRSLTDGTELVSANDLAEAGAEVTEPDVMGRVTVSAGFFRVLTLVAPPQRVEIDLKTQRLRGWQGARLVLESRISSGRRGSTPAGDFMAGPFRARMHRSSRYQNAPMPWSVQINGHIFVHGFTSVPRYPASHGCVRLPLDEGNPARFFYEWVENGTPVRVTK